MKTKTTIPTIIAVIAFAAQSWGMGTILDNQLPPWERITLTNNVSRVVTSITVPINGHWNFSGGATIQTNTNFIRPDQHIFTVAALTTDPNASLFTVGADHTPNMIRLDGTVSLDARGYATWWFDADPNTHAFRLDAGQTVYLVVQYYSYIPVPLVQAFGSINAIRVPAN